MPRVRYVWYNFRMEPNTERQKKDGLINWISFVVIILVLGGVFWYLYQTQKDTVAMFQDSVQRLQQETILIQ
mgnify:CR=1 FL=1